MIIGFPKTNLPVNENDGSISVCTKILQPTGSDAIENTTFKVNMTTYPNDMPDGKRSPFFGYCYINEILCYRSNIN